MDACQPEVVRIRVRCCPKKAPCPKCGKLGKRKRRPLHRTVRSIAYQKIVHLDITYGEYRATCGCCKTFRTQPPGIAPKGKYDNKVRDAVLNRILDDAMNVEAVLRALRRDFCLELSSGFIYDCLRAAAGELDLAEKRRFVLEHFSGTLDIDELHLGRYTLLLATDPLRDMPVAFALVASNDQDHMQRFLTNLKNWGLMPKVVVTDGSSLYPALLAQLWPKAEHQLCIFHVIQDINKHLLDEVRRLRTKLARRGNAGRRRRRGRPRHGAKRDRRLTNKDKSSFIFKHRHLIVKRRENLTDTERQHLRTMQEYLPELATVRSFADAVYRLFHDSKTDESARRRRGRMLRQPAYAKHPGLVKALKILTPDDKFDKMMAFLRSPVKRRVRTNNHVEGTNRRLRFFEKVRYKWRRRRTLVRFLVLALDRWWEKKRIELAETPVLRSCRPKATLQQSRANSQTQPPKAAARKSAA